MIVCEHNPHATWIAADLAVEHLDGEPGEQVTDSLPPEAVTDLHGWLMDQQAAATP